MKEAIIQTAGKTWTLLGKKGQTEVEQMPLLLKQKKEVVLQALGWLAREDKITYCCEKDKTYVALVENEYQMFKALYPQVEASSTTKAAKKTKVKK